MMEMGRQPACRNLLDIAMDMVDDRTGTRLDDYQLRALVFTFLFAGHETTGVSMSWTLYELAKYPQIQETIRKEANEVLGDGMYCLLVDAKLKAAQTFFQRPFYSTYDLKKNVQWFKSPPTQQAVGLQYVLCTKDLFCPIRSRVGFTGLFVTDTLRMYREGASPLIFHLFFPYFSLTLPLGPRDT